MAKRMMWSMCGVVALAGASILVRPAPCGACSPVPFAETWALELDSRTIDGEAVSPLPSVQSADLSASHHLDSLFFRVTLDDGGAGQPNSLLLLEVAR